MSSRRSGEEGVGLVVVIMLMGMMLTTGFAVLSTVDVQSGQSKTERVGESAFNLAESALNAQIFALSRDWPGLGRAALPYTTCTQATPSPRCPDHASLVGGASSDLVGATWQSSVHDNGGTGSSFYSDATRSALGYDFNKDGKVWVRAQAIAQGRKRTLIALVRSEQQEEDLPRGVIAGSLEISNKGNKELIRGNGGTVAVRCTTSLLSSTPCLGHAVQGVTGTLEKLLSLLATQITGSTAIEGYSGGDGMTAEARARLKATAISDGTYHDSATGCPTDAELTGQVVYLSGLNCTYDGNARFNSVASPGALILDGSTVTFEGTTKYFGVVYAANTTAGGTAVTTQGDALINGGVVIDGTARMVAGSSGLNISYDVNAFRAVASYGAAGVIQNTFREIKGA